MSRNQNWSFLRQNITKSIGWVSSLLDLLYSQKTKTNPGSVFATGILGLSLFPVNILKIEQASNLSDGKTSLTSSKYVKSLERVIKRWCLFQSLVQDQSTKFIARATAPQWHFQKNYVLKIFKRKFALKQKVIFLPIST